VDSTVRSAVRVNGLGPSGSECEVHLALGRCASCPMKITFCTLL
jgi:hypothetical protein